MKRSSRKNKGLIYKNEELVKNNTTTDRQLTAMLLDLVFKKLATYVWNQGNEKTT